MRVTARAAVDALFTAQALVTAALLMEEESQSQGHLSALAQWLVITVLWSMNERLGECLNGQITQSCSLIIGEKLYKVLSLSHQISIKKNASI